MRKSSIAIHTGWGPGTPFATELGEEVRRRRKALGLTQGDLGHPLTKGFVSGVELGRIVPSLPALAHLAWRLDVSVGDLLQGVKGQWTGVYTPRHDHRAQTPDRRR